MILKWLGNSTFLIKTSSTKQILIDPFTPLEILNINTSSIDIITFSKSFPNISDYKFNSNIKVLYNDYSYNDGLIKIKTYLSYSDNLSGAKRGKNYIHTYEIDGLKICHLGYLGELLNDELINVLKNVDILLIPIGGNLCLNGIESFTLTKLLNPKYIIPMCYKSNNLDFYFDGPLEYLSKSKNIFYISESDINTNTLPNNPSLTIFLRY